MEKPGHPDPETLAFISGVKGDEMEYSIDQKILAFSRFPNIKAYDISATFGDGQPGRIKKRFLDKNGEYHLDTQAWEAGDVAYQSLKHYYPQGITEIEFSNDANEHYLLVRDLIYPDVLSLAEAGKIFFQPNGIEGMKKAWANYGWCERVMFALDLYERVLDSDADAVANEELVFSMNMVLSLVLLQKLEDAVISEFFDGDGKTHLMLEIASLRDRLQPPKHVEIAIQKLQTKLDAFKQARRRGADVIHVTNRSMKAEVFLWLDSQDKFKSNEAAAMAITKQQPIAHVTARDWYKEWKKLRSASTP